MAATTLSIRELMERLHAIFPWPSPEALVISTQDYRAVLARYAGEPLAAAWIACIADWRFPKRPLPADILAKVERRVRGGENLQLILGAAKAISADLIAAWWRDNGDLVEEWTTDLGCLECNREAFRWRVESMVGKRAWTAAQLQARGKPARIILSRGDINKAFGTSWGSEAEESAGAFGSFRAVGQAAEDLSRARPKPLHLPRSMGDRLAAVGLAVDETGP